MMAADSTGDEVLEHMLRDVCELAGADPGKLKAIACISAEARMAASTSRSRSLPGYH